MRVLGLNHAFIASILTATVVNCGGGQSPEASKLREAPDYRNKPALMGVATKPYDSLIKEARLSDDHLPWSDDYWPTFRGGISFRWQKNHGGFSFRDYKYKLMREEEVFNLKQKDLDQLSPAEKYDLLLGDFNFGLTRSEKAGVDRAMREDNGEIPYWFGLCHGWAVASYMEKEPGAVASVLSPDGLQLNFYASDLKALLTKHYSDTQVRTNFIGGRCDEKKVKRDAQGRPLLAECRDVNPATFHLVVEDYVAHQGKSFVMDLDGEFQVWNHPIIGYQFTYDKLRRLDDDPKYRHAAEGTVQLIDVDMHIQYVQASSPSRRPIRSSISQRKFRYTLELDQGGLIVGGEWTGDAKPDFMWELERLPERSADGELNYQLLQHLVNLSRSEISLNRAPHLH